MRALDWYGGCRGPEVCAGGEAAAAERGSPGWGHLSRSPAETARLGAALGRRARAGDVLLLSGRVGAGKTVLAAAVLDGLGVPGPHPSPTFTLLRSYRGRLPAVHADLYRLEGPIRADEIGWDEDDLAEGVTVVEWGERLGALCPEDALRLRIEPGPGPEERRLEFTPGGPRAGRWLAALRADAEGKGSG